MIFRLPGLDMGYHATNHAFRLGAELNLGDRAKVVFLWMAHICLDSDDSAIEPRRYFGGFISLATALGFSAPDNASEGARRAVKRAIKELVDKGAIKRVSHGRAGQNAVYELLIPSKPRERQTTVRSIRPLAPTFASLEVIEGDAGRESWETMNAF
ncbi:MULTISPECIES: hypothetical protein [unclassified Agreia]|uniref:hypothetical protein n=1 Tax=unclassified Agreia TaxID=2641148 RepID=UPI000A8CE1BE|nr:MULTISPECIES: hypothetical protein [unclassified Agreia]